MISADYRRERTSMQEDQTRSASHDYRGGAPDNRGDDRNMVLTPSLKALSRSLAGRWIALCQSLQHALMQGSLPLRMTRAWNEMQLQRTAPRPYAIVVFAIFIAFLMTDLLQSTFHVRTSALFFAAVAVSAACGGLGPGALATVLSAVAYSFFLLPGSANTFEAEMIPLALFALVALLISVLSDGLHSAERSAAASRDQAEAAALRAWFLAEAGSLLNRSLEYEQNLICVAERAVPYLANWISIDLALPNGSLRRHFTAGRSPANDRAIAVDPDEAARRAARVASTGQAEFYPQMRSEMNPGRHSKVAGSAERLRLHTLDWKSCICVPIQAREGVLGTLTCARSESGSQPYTTADLSLFKDLAARMAIAIDNANLYREAQAEISERKRAEERIEALNARLRIAMTETHHRVKNNLQLIADMIDLQVMAAAESVPVDQVRQLARNILALAEVHDVLTDEARMDGQGNTISMQVILQNLLLLLRRTMPHVRIESSLKDVRLSAKQGSSVALIVNELVCNALKYGRGTVRVTLDIEGDRALLKVIDNGPGFPEGFNPEDTSNTGLELVEQLTRCDLRGTTSYETRSEGSMVIVTFPLSPTC